MVFPREGGALMIDVKSRTTAFRRQKMISGRIKLLGVITILVIVVAVIVVVPGNFLLGVLFGGFGVTLAVCLIRF